MGTKDYTRCRICKEKLKDVKVTRNKPKMCSLCRGDTVSNNISVYRMYQHAIANPKEPAEDEMVFEDDPKAAEYDKNEKGKVSRTTTHVSTETILSEIIVQ